MDPVSSVDQLVLLLRQRLSERARTTAAGSGKAAGRGAERAASPLDTVQALAATEGIDDRQLKRALVQTLLAERFGDGLINDARFQQIVDKVTDAIDDSPGASDLLARVVQDLRTQAR